MKSHSARPTHSTKSSTQSKQSHKPKAETKTTSATPKAAVVSTTPRIRRCVAAAPALTMAMHRMPTVHLPMEACARRNRRNSANNEETRDRDPNITIAYNVVPPLCNQSLYAPIFENKNTLGSMHCPGFGLLISVTQNHVENTLNATNLAANTTTVQNEIRVRIAVVRVCRCETIYIGIASDISRSRKGNVGRIAPGGREFCSTEYKRATKKPLMNIFDTTIELTASSGRLFRSRMLDVNWRYIPRRTPRLRRSESAGTTHACPETG
jgi:hypothetical protein